MAVLSVILCVVTGNVGVYGRENIKEMPLNYVLSIGLQIVFFSYFCYIQGSANVKAIEAYSSLMEKQKEF